MPYVGKNPTIGNFVKLDAITTSATATYNLTNGGVAFSPQSPNHCIVSLNGVIQSPTSAYTISGSTIVFDSALTASDVIDFILVLGDVLNIGTPSDATVGFAKVTSNLITGATAVTTPATDDVLLCYDTSATALRKITFADFGSTPAFEARLSTNQSITNLTATKVQFDTEIFDTDSCYDNTTNYRFTPTVAGKYFAYSTVTGRDALTGTFNISQVNIDLRKNGSTLRLISFYYNALAVTFPLFVSGSIDMNGTTDYLEIFVTFRSSNSAATAAYSDSQTTYFGAYRLIGV